MVKRTQDTDLKKSQSPYRINPSSKIIKRSAPGLKAMQEIRQYQSSTNLLLGKAQFKRLLIGITGSLFNSNTPVKYSSAAIEALQYAAESYVTEILEDSNLCAEHGKRLTLLVKDMQLAKRIRSRFENFY